MLTDAQYLDSTPADGEEIRRLLDSQLERDKMDGMEHLIALISLGHDAGDFFPSVVKNVVAGSVELKRLVYMFLVHYAEEKQELALLSINTFQKDLSDSNQLIRALALRVMSCVHHISRSYSSPLYATTEHCWPHVHAGPSGLQSRPKW